MAKRGRKKGEANTSIIKNSGEACREHYYEAKKTNVHDGKLIYARMYPFYHNEKKMQQVPIFL